MRKSFGVAPAARLAVLLVLLAGCGSAPTGSSVAAPSAPPGEATRDPVEVDHVYLWVTPGAEAEMDALRGAGFNVDAEPTRHPGQGTAAVSVEFENAYLELIYLDPEVPVDPDMEPEVADFRRRSAWRETRASPIGIGLHRTPEASGPLPFPTRPYRPAWLREGTVIERLGSETDTLAPRMFVVPDYLAVEDSVALAARVREDPAFGALLEHPVGVRRLTGVRVVVADQRALTGATRLLTDRGVVEIGAGAEPLLELTFDAARRGRVADLRPVLPLLVRY